jgi:hypothetical protein
MSESGGAAPAAAGGWQQSAAPFAGLTATDLSMVARRRAKLLALRESVRPEALRSARRKWAVDGQRRTPSMSKHYEDMLDALRTSVIEIVNANPADRDAKLEKTFASYQAALSKSLGADLLLPVDEVDPISLMGDRIGRLNEAVQALEKGLVPGAEMLSEQALMLAKSVVEYGSLALNAAAADFAELVQEGDEVEDGMGLYKIASHSQGQEILVKSALPPAAAELTADPEDTGSRLAEFFLEGLDWLGVPVKLAKRMPPQFARGKKGAEQEEGDDEGQEVPEAEDEEGAEEEMPEDAEDGGDEGVMDQAGQGDEGNHSNPFDKIARAATLGLLELDQLRQQLGDDAVTGDGEQLSALDAMGQHLALVATQAQALGMALQGGGEGEMMEGGEDPEGAAPTQDTVPDEAMKATPNNGLEKGAAAVAGVLKQNQDIQEELRKAQEGNAALQAKVAELSKLAAQPSDPKAATGIGAQVLTKEGDSSGQREETAGETADRLAKMAPEQAAHELLKMAFQRPVQITG